MALLPRDFLDCIIPIGVETDRQSWIATGFLVGRPTEEDPKKFSVFLVTNKHVIQDVLDCGLDSFVIGLNPKEGPPRITAYPCSLYQDQEEQWTSHSQEDIAVLHLKATMLQEHKQRFNFFRTNENLITIDQMTELGLSEGDFVYILGYPMPMQLIDPDRHSAIVRSGSIARIRDALDWGKTDFLVDGFAFPGNSGGPVISKPEAMAITGTPAVNSAYVIGIVKEFVPYSEEAISVQSGRTCVVFEENSGLSRVIPAGLILETIEAHIERLRAKE